MDMEVEIERVRGLLPTEPPAGAYDTMVARGYLQRNVLIYSAEWITQGEKKGRAVKLCCTACGREGYAEHKPYTYQCWKGGYGTECGFVHPMTSEVMRGHADTLCPFCGAPVTTRHRSDMQTESYIDHVCVMSVHNLDGYLALIKWNLEKVTDKNGHAYFIGNGEEAAVLIGKRLVRYNKAYRNFSGYVQSYAWEARKRFDDHFDAVSMDRILPFDANAILQSNASKSALETLLTAETEKCYPIKYLRIWQKWPVIENLIRRGCSPLVDSYIGTGTRLATYRRKSFDYDVFSDIDLKKAKPHEILGIQKEEVAKVGGMTAAEFKFYRLMRERGIEDVDEMLHLYRRDNYGNPYEFFSENAQIPIVRTMRYLQKQKAACVDKTFMGFRYLQDYWEILKAVQGTIDDALRYPKDLVREHDRFLARKKEKENEALSLRIQDLVKDLERLAWADEELGLLIRPAASHAEFITEGKVLSHCVAMYAKDHANQKTAIFFIRKITEPDIPFYTLEYKNGKVQQNRGKKNCARTEEVKEFEARWLKHIKEGEKRVG